MRDECIRMHSRRDVDAYYRYQVVGTRYILTYEHTYIVYMLYMLYILYIPYDLYILYMPYIPYTL